jgi:hypothetical protein
MEDNINFINTRYLSVIDLSLRSFHCDKTFNSKHRPHMAVNVFLNLPGGLKMPSLGFGTWEVSFKYIKFIESKKISCTCKF